MPLNKETKPNQRIIEVPTFSIGIIPKLKAAVWLVFELVYYDDFLQGK